MLSYKSGGITALNIQVKISPPAPCTTRHTHTHTETYFPPLLVKKLGYSRVSKSLDFANCTLDAFLHVFLSLTFPLKQWFHLQD